MTSQNNDQKEGSGLPSKAWMLKYDGLAVPVISHIYGDVGDPESNIEAALFLYTYSPEQAIQQMVKDYFYTYCSYVLAQCMKSSGDMNTDLMMLPAAISKQLGGNPGAPVNMSRQEAVSVIMQGVEHTEDCYDDMFDTGFEVNDNSGDAINERLNEDYIRVRTNGEYGHDKKSEGNVFFRIGSKYRNWSGTISDFVEKQDLRSVVDRIIIERDRESDNPGGLGGSFRYVLINMSLEDYYKGGMSVSTLGSRRPLGLCGDIYDILNSGGSIEECYKLDADRERISASLKSVAELARSQYTRVENPFWKAG